MLVDEDERPLGAHRNQVSSTARSQTQHRPNVLLQKAASAVGLSRGNILSRQPALWTYLSFSKANEEAGGDILGALSFMKKAFLQNGRRNIAVVVDLLFLNEDPICAITTPVDEDYLGTLPERFERENVRKFFQFRDFRKCTGSVLLNEKGMEDGMCIYTEQQFFVFYFQ